MDNGMNGEESEYAWDSRVGGAVSSRNRHRRREQTRGPRSGKEGGMNWETGINIYSLLPIKQITNENQVYGTENSTQYTVVT